MSEASLWSSGSTRCPGARAGGQRRPLRRPWPCSATCSRLSSSSTASERSSSKTRSVLSADFRREIRILPRQNADQVLQFWRLLSTFLYFGPLSLDLLFHIFFLQRYSRLLEESTGRSAAHFSWLLLYATTTLLALSPLLSMPFLGSALSSTLVYIWARRNPETRLSFLGVLVFTAPYLPWVLMAFSLLLHNTIPKDEICGIIVGHGKTNHWWILEREEIADGRSLVFF